MDWKDVYDLLKRAGNVEAQEQIMALREDYLKLKVEHLELQDEVRLLREKLDFRDTLVYEAPHYWRVRNDCREGPYCQLCHDKEAKMIRLHQQTHDRSWFCHSCNNTFYGADYSPPNYNTVVKG